MQFPLPLAFSSYFSTHDLWRRLTRTIYPKKIIRDLWNLIFIRWKSIRKKIYQPISTKVARISRKFVSKIPWYFIKCSKFRLHKWRTNVSKICTRIFSPEEYQIYIEQIKLYNSHNSQIIPRKRYKRGILKVIEWKWKWQSLQGKKW